MALYCTGRTCSADIKICAGCIERLGEIKMIDFEVKAKAKATASEHDQVLIDALIKLYHRKSSPSFESYQEGLQAGIRYTLLALNQKVPGINDRREVNGDA